MRHELFRLPDQRLLSYAEYGDGRGFPVVLCHGIPGSRFQRHPDESIARRAGVRVIVPERPGYGASSALEGGTVANWADDLAALAEHLGLSRLALAGVSGGAPYALAGAHRLHQRVTRVALVSGVAPDLLAHRLNPWSRLTLHVAQRNPRALGRMLALPASMAARRPAGYIRLWAWRARSADRRILALPDVARVIAEDVPTALAQGATGIARDLCCIMADWDFAPGKIRAPVTIWHGEADRSVPLTCAAKLATSLSSAQVIHVPDAGHLVVFELWAAMLAWLVR
ncbi:MAG TPA: alpha/beta hydrolase [Rhodocyclaceae bacterium]|nr:alpha/beta hydrolase [Rhodocyclaceae bacterium]